MNGWARKRKKRLGTSQTEFVCKVEIARCPDEESRMSASTLSASRISPIITRFGDPKFCVPMNMSSTVRLPTQDAAFPTYALNPSSAVEVDRTHSRESPHSSDCRDRDARR
jgi:hypothetical protein